jgi:hypothetical protein
MARSCKAAWPKKAGNLKNHLPFGFVHLTLTSHRFLLTVCLIWKLESIISISSLFKKCRFEHGTLKYAFSVGKTNMVTKNATTFLETVHNYFASQAKTQRTKIFFSFRQCLVFCTYEDVTFVESHVPCINVTNLVNLGKSDNREPSHGKS